MINKIVELDKKIFLLMYKYGENNKGIYGFFQSVTNMSKGVFITIYCSILGYTYFHRYESLIYVVTIPFLTLVTSLITRKLVNRKRPYKIFNIPLPVKKIGSLPSNHSVSSFIISFTCMYINLFVGIPVFILAMLTSSSRVFIGIHFPLDIVVGLLISFLYSLLFIFFM